MNPKVLVVCRFFVFVFLVTKNGRSEEPRRTLTVGGFYASGDKTTWQNASDVVELVRRAVEEINDHPDVLPGYEIKVHWEDTKVKICFQSARLQFTPSSDTDSVATNNPSTPVQKVHSTNLLKRNV